MKKVHDKENFCFMLNSNEELTDIISDDSDTIYCNQVLPLLGKESKTIILCPCLEAL